MTRAAALLLAFVTSAAVSAQAQDSTPAPRRTAVRSRQQQTRAPRPVPRPAQTGDTSRATPTPPGGFAMQTRVEPDTVTVGDRFATGVAVSVPSGTRVALEIAKDSADRWRVLGAINTTQDSVRSRWVLAANMVAWEPGISDSLTATLKLTGAEGRVVNLPVKLAFPTVRAVLLEDSTRWVVRPPHDVWGPSVDPKRTALGIGAIILALLLLALVVLMLIRAIRRRRARRIPATARERALALLERARTSGFAEAGNWKAFYTLIGEALRGYLATIERALSEDLTTSEVIEEMRRAGRSEEDIETLKTLLGVGDLAKFARRGRTPEDAVRDLDLAREWVERYGPPVTQPVDDSESSEAAVEVAP
jgi:hypothetical protein